MNTYTTTRLASCSCLTPERCWHLPLPPFEADERRWRHFCATVVWRIEATRVEP